MSGIFVILAVSSGGGGGGGAGPRPAIRHGSHSAKEWGGGSPVGGGRVRRAPPRDPPLVSKQ